MDEPMENLPGKITALDSSEGNTMPVLFASSQPS